MSRFMERTCLIKCNKRMEEERMFLSKMLLTYDTDVSILVLVKQFYGIQVIHVLWKPLQPTMSINGTKLVKYHKSIFFTLLKEKHGTVTYLVLSYFPLYYIIFPINLGNQEHLSSQNVDLKLQMGPESLSTMIR